MSSYAVSLQATNFATWENTLARDKASRKVTMESVVKPLALSIPTAGYEDRYGGLSLRMMAAGDALAL